MMHLLLFYTEGELKTEKCVEPHYIEPSFLTDQFLKLSGEQIPVIPKQCQPRPFMHHLILAALLLAYFLIPWLIRNATSDEARQFLFIWFIYPASLSSNVYRLYQ